MNIGWWLQFFGGILGVLSAFFLLIGFVISPNENIIKSIKNYYIKQQIHYGIGDNIAGDKIVTEIKSSFSQTQSIKTLPSSLGGIDYLNLDNVATLKLYVPSSLNKVTLLLDVVPISLPDQHNKAFIVEDAQYYNQSLGKQYIFDAGENKRHEIEVGGRVFIITLLKIIKLNITDVPGALEYQFGISER
mgnify:CR=1 FL=1